MFFLFPCMSLSIDANFIEQVEKSFFLFSGWVCVRIGIFFLNICRIHQWSHLGLYFCCFIFFFMGRFFNCKFNFFNRIQSYSGIYFLWNVVLVVCIFRGISCKLSDLLQKLIVIPYHPFNICKICSHFTSHSWILLVSYFFLLIILPRGLSLYWSQCTSIWVQ